jgi:microfibrillar-associated protein 1
LQKYYHAGAFYLDENDPVFQRDFSAPTGADATVDRTLLPQVLQVKKFGVKGRTKCMLCVVWSEALRCAVCAVCCVVV